MHITDTKKSKGTVKDDRIPRRGDAVILTNGGSTLIAHSGEGILELETGGIVGTGDLVPAPGGRPRTWLIDAHFNP